MMEEEEEEVEVGMGGEGEGLPYSFTPHDSINTIQYNTIGANKSPPKLHKSSIYHTYKSSYLHFNF
jgi:hypothetical protein